MRIAICDDDAQDLALLSQLLSDCAPDDQVACFSSAAELYASSREIRYDAVILDIEMEAPNGYDIALELAREDSHPVILFLTNSAAYAVRGYGLALRYLLKPVTAQMLTEALDAVHRAVHGNRLTLELDGNAYAFGIHDIYYAEVQNHHITLHTAEGNYPFRSPLKALISQLPERWFCAPHQSYVVNLLHVRSVTPQGVVLTSGVRLPVSRRRLTEFVRRFHSFLGV